MEHRFTPGIGCAPKRPVLTSAGLGKTGAESDGVGNGRDQASVKGVLWGSDLRFWVLPPEWNLRRVTLLGAWEPMDAGSPIVHSHQLLRHLRAGDVPVGDLADILTLEREALKLEWSALEQRLLTAEVGDPIARFRRARDLQRE